MAERIKRVCDQSQRILNKLFFLPPSSLSFLSFLSFLSLPLVSDMSDILLERLEVADGFVCMGGGARDGGGAKGGGPTGSTQYRRSRMLKGQCDQHASLKYLLLVRSSFPRCPWWPRWCSWMKRRCIGRVATDTTPANRFEIFDEAVRGSDVCRT